jgi:drug/metabolite transporter (DMT)-like permease
MRATGALPGRARPTIERTAPVAGVVLVAAGAALWGTDAVLRQPLVDQWSSWTIVMYEHAILTAIVAPYLIRHRHELARLDRAGWASAVAIAWGASALATLAFTAAFRSGNPDVVILLQKTQPLWAIATAGVVVGERPRIQALWLAGPVTVGVYLLSFGAVSPRQALTGGELEPALLALTAAALWGSATAFGRRALQEVSAPVLTGLRFTLALPLLFAIAAYQGALAPPAGAPASDWLRLPMLALGPGLVAMLLYYRGLRTTPAPVATLAELAFPTTALILNRVFLGATVDAWQLVGFAILWLTIACLYRMPVRVPAAAGAGAPAEAAAVL